MHGDDYENTQEGNNVFLLEVDSLQKLGHNFFGAKYSASSSYYYMPRKFVQLGSIIEKSFGGIRGILMDLSCRCEK